MNGKAAHIPAERLKIDISSLSFTTGNRTTGDRKLEHFRTAYDVNHSLLY